MKLFHYPLLLAASGLSLASPPEQNPAHLVGDLVGETPAIVEAAKPEFVVPAEDILQTETIQQGGRTITLREIKPIDLPAPLTPEPVEQTVTQEPSIGSQAAQADSSILHLGATVYRSKDSQVRSFVSLYSAGQGEPVTFWSAADFGLLSGCSSFADSEGATRHLIMAWDEADLTTTPTIPSLPEGNATFVITSDNPSAEAQAAVQALHSLYNNEYHRLKAAAEERKRLRVQEEAALKANPPQPKPITLNYWRVVPSAAASQKGGDQ